MKLIFALSCLLNLNAFAQSVEPAKAPAGAYGSDEQMDPVSKVCSSVGLNENLDAQGLSAATVLIYSSGSVRVLLDFTNAARLNAKLPASEVKETRSQYFKTTVLTGLSFMGGNGKLNLTPGFVEYHGEKIAVKCY